MKWITKQGSRATCRSLLNLFLKARSIRCVKAVSEVLSKKNRKCLFMSNYTLSIIIMYAVAFEKQGRINSAGPKQQGAPLVQQEESCKLHTIDYLYNYYSYNNCWAASHPLKVSHSPLYAQDIYLFFPLSHRHNS